MTKMIKGVLLEADKVQDFGGGPMKFTREELEQMAVSFNARDKAKGVGFEHARLVMDGDSLVCEMRDVDLGCGVSSKALAAAHKIDLSELIKR